METAQAGGQNDGVRNLGSAPRLHSALGVAYLGCSEEIPERARFPGQLCQCVVLHFEAEGILSRHMLHPVAFRVAQSGRRDDEAVAGAKQPRRPSCGPDDFDDALFDDEQARTSDFISAFDSRSGGAVACVEAFGEKLQVSGFHV